MTCSVFVFFFQAEDGIRDADVTGVQTCALPIFEPGHPYEQGIREDMPIDHCLHSVFGASKVAADVMAQEYGRYFGMRTACFRGGTLTGPNHSATELHGFLASGMRSTAPT